jgi:hypothetical protein
MSLGRLNHAMLIMPLALQSLAFLCASPAAAQGELAAARRAVFPHGTNLAEGEETRHFDTNRLVDTPFGPVLVSEGYIEMASHATPGVIAVHYLRRRGAGFAVRRAFPTAVEAGSHGGMAHWNISHLFTGLPAIYTEGGGTWQGYTCVVAQLTELQPAGPVEIASIPIYYDNAGLGREERANRTEGPRRFAGQIVNVRRGTSFDVRFTGTASFTDHYVYRDGRFVRTTRESRAAC